jgi:DNA-binding response OmpR family regulator
MQSSTVLLVQQATDTGTRLRTRLEATGYKVLQAADPESAMTMLAASEVALVVTELYLPIGTSRCLVRTIRKTGWLRRTRVLAYTTHGSPADRAWARKSGAQGYVITRSGEDRLVQVVDSLMRKAAAAASIPSPVQPRQLDA